MFSVTKSETKSRIDMSKDGKTLYIVMPDITLTLDGIDTQKTIEFVKKAQEQNTIDFTKINEITKDDVRIDIAVNKDVALTEEINSRAYSFFVNFINVFNNVKFKSIRGEFSHNTFTLRKKGTELTVDRKDNVCEYSILFGKGITQVLPKEIMINAFAELLGAVAALYEALNHYGLYKDLSHSLYKTLQQYKQIIN